MSLSSADWNCFCESSPSGTPCSRANDAPPHDGRLVATATTLNPRSTRFRRLDPLPETATPSLSVMPGLIDDHAVGAASSDHLADHQDAFRHLLWIDHQDHPEAHVERAVHLVVGDPTALADHLEYLRDLPGGAVQARSKPVRQAAGKVAENSAAGDVGRALPTDSL